MKNGFSAMDIAKWFIWKNYAEQIENVSEDDEYEVYEGVTHLKLQKLLYFAQGLSLAINNKKVFSEAWTHGPVIKEVYSDFSVCGRNEIKYSQNWNQVIEKINANSETFKILQLTYNNFGGYTAWQLREMSHVFKGPWQNTVSEKGMNSIIDSELIRNYFKNEIVEG